jgi:hypothetical protein
MEFVGDDKISISKHGGRQGPAEIFNEDGASILKGNIFSDEVSLRTRALSDAVKGRIVEVAFENQYWAIRMRNIKYAVRSPLDIPRINGDIDPILVAVLRQQHGNMVVFDSADLIAQRGEQITVTTNASGMTVVRLERNG